MNNAHHIFRIAGIEEESIVDGPGIRNTIFFQGCSHHCKGCHNPDTWSLDGGTEIDLFDTINQWKNNELIDGITLSGGDPLNFLFFIQEDYERFNHELCKIHNLITYCHEIYNGNVILYTGWDELTLLQILAKCKNENDIRYWKDLLLKVRYFVTGPYHDYEQSIDCAFRGSSNQHIVTFVLLEKLKQSLKIIDQSQYFDSKIVNVLETKMKKEYPYKFNKYWQEYHL